MLSSNTEGTQQEERLTLMGLNCLRRNCAAAFSLFKGACLTARAVVERVMNEYIAICAEKLTTFRALYGHTGATEDSDFLAECYRTTKAR